MYKVSVGSCEGKRLLKGHMRKLEDNIRMDRKGEEAGCKRLN
jgi:hypothetical protein